MDFIADRWSPYVFEPRAVEQEKLTSCLEAARWAASSFNEQPWAFLVATRDNESEFQRILSCLVEPNQAWAKDAGALVITAICPVFSRNDNPNRVAEHDLGLAVGNFTIQATALGLAVHQMAGIDIEKTRTELEIPDTHQPMTAIAVGYPGNLDDADEQMAQRDRGPRQRKPLGEIVFGAKWGSSTGL